MSGVLLLNLIMNTGFKTVLRLELIAACSYHKAHVNKMQQKMVLPLFLYRERKKKVSCVKLKYNTTKFLSNKQVCIISIKRAFTNVIT